MSLVDSHCHLDFPDFAQERAAVIARARAAGIGTMVTICTKITEFAEVRAIAEVTGMDERSVFFRIEAWNGERRIGGGTHRRGVVNLREFEQRFGVREGALA